MKNMVLCGVLIEKMGLVTDFEEVFCICVRVCACGYVRARVCL